MNTFKNTRKGLHFSCVFNFYQQVFCCKKEIPLKLGLNALDDKLKIQFEQKYKIEGRPWEYKITPLNFPAGFPKDYRFWLTFDFTTNIQPQVIVAGMAFSTKNNSYCGRNQKFFDGKVAEITSKVKRAQTLIREISEHRNSRDVQRPPLL